MSNLDTEQSVAQGIIDAQIINSSVGVISTEIFILAVIIGVHFHSWYLFGAVIFLPFILLMLSLKFKPFTVLYLVLLALLGISWGVLGFIFGSLMEMSAGIVIGLIALCLGLSSNLAPVIITLSGQTPKIKRKDKKINNPVTADIYSKSKKSVLIRCHCGNQFTAKTEVNGEWFGVCPQCGKQLHVNLNEKQKDG